MEILKSPHYFPMSGLTDTHSFMYKLRLTTFSITFTMITASAKIPCCGHILVLRWLTVDPAQLALRRAALSAPAAAQVEGDSGLDIFADATVDESVAVADDRR